MIISSLILLLGSKGFAQSKQELFCEKLSNAIQMQLPMDMQIGQARLAAMQLVDLIRNEQASDYLAVNSLRTSNLAAIYNSSDRFVSTANILRDAIDLNKNKPAMLIPDASELRFLPFAQQGSQYIVLAKSAAPLNLERAEVVVNAAASAHISLSIIWYGPELKDPANQAQADLLNMISQRTRGQFIDLSGSTNTCGTRS
jgi:hypothetical protein